MTRNTTSGKPRNLSHFFIPEWKLLHQSETWITHERLGSISKVFPALTRAQLNFTVVDRDFGPLLELRSDRSFIKHVTIQDCPVATRKQMEALGYARTEWSTIIIDLQPPLEDIWQSVRKSARKLVRRTQHLCTVSRVTSIAQLREYYELVKGSRRELGLPMYNWRWQMRLWESLHPGAYEVFCVRDESGSLLAGMAVLYTGEFMQEMSAGQSARARDQSIYANDLLKWEIIKWGHEQGIKRYDLAGMHPDPPAGSKHEGIRIFKKKWGGTEVPIDQFTLVRGDTAVFRILRSLYWMYRS